MDIANLAPAPTAARAIAAAMVRHGLTVAGTALVAHGWLDKSTADAAISPLADQAIGLAIVSGSAAWSWARAHVTHTRWARAWAVLTGEAAG